MRARIALVAAVAAAGAAYAVPAHALLCPPALTTACETLCKIDRTIGRPCPR